MTQRKRRKKPTTRNRILKQSDRAIQGRFPKQIIQPRTGPGSIWDRDGDGRQMEKTKRANPFAKRFQKRRASYKSGTYHVSQQGEVKPC